MLSQYLSHWDVCLGMWETEVQVSAPACTLSRAVHAGENAPARPFSTAFSLKGHVLTAVRNLFSCGDLRRPPVLTALSGAYQGLQRSPFWF